jgi:hypothetical protein
MRKITSQIIGLFILLLSANTSAQINWPTYSVTPPTSGCNGVWAINTSSTLSACGGTPYTYSFTPTGCGQSSGIVFKTDTLLVPLCSTPCSMTIFNVNGQDCSAATGGTTGVSENPGIRAKLYPTQLLPGGNLTIEFGESVSTKTIQLFDNAGKMVNSEVTTSAELKLVIPLTASGIYFVTIYSSAGWTELHKVFIESKK